MQLSKRHLDRVEFFKILEILSRVRPASEKNTVRLQLIFVGVKVNRTPAAAGFRRRRLLLGVPSPESQSRYFW